MIPLEGGGPAFPSSFIENGDTKALFKGMTLRDYFAVKTLSGLLAIPEFDETPEVTARLCYRAADAMLAERSK